MNHRVVIIFNVGDELQHALVQFRQQHIGRQVHQHADQHPCHRQAEGTDAPARQAAGLLGFHRPGAEAAALDEVDDRGQQIGHEDTVDHGTKRIQQLAPEVKQILAAEQRIIKQQNTRHGQKHRDAKLYISVFSCQFNTASLLNLFYTAAPIIAIRFLP